MPVTSAVAVVGNGQKVKDKGDSDNHNHIEEVIHSNDDHHEFPVITGPLEQPVNRR